jgi:hypothetical protein
MRFDFTSPSISDELKPLREFAKHPLLRHRRNGKAINYVTLWRWCNRGMRGCRLEFVKVGGIPFTSERKLLDFFSAITPKPEGTVIAPRSPVQRQRASRRAKKQLEKAGF